MLFHGNFHFRFLVLFCTFVVFRCALFVFFCASCIFFCSFRLVQTWFILSVCFFIMFDFILFGKLCDAFLLVLSSLAFLSVQLLNRFISGLIPIEQSWPLAAFCRRVCAA